MLCAQSLSGTLPSPVVENILLNTHTWSMFQTRPDEADLLFPHVLHEHGDPRSESERRREFQRQMQSLAQRHFYFLAKGHPALACTTPNVPDPAVAAHRPAEELLEVFDRQIAPNSMIGMDVAARLIAEWENEVVGQQQVATGPSTPTTSQAPSGVGLDQLRRILGGNSSKEQP
jgi:hypothetical protein